MTSIDIAIIIGRFQPFHNGHVSLLKKASEVSKNIVILLGSSYQPSTIKNPWSWVERSEMIKEFIDSEQCDFMSFETHNIEFCPIVDYIYNNGSWVDQIQTVVSKSIDRLRKCPGGLEFSSTYDNTNICLVGHHKEGDRSNFYLDMFPQWKYVESETTFLSDGKLLDASDIRDSYFSGDHPFSLAVPNSVANFLVENSTTHWFFRLKLERLYYLNYSREWGTGPFVTVDSFVYCCGHVLLIQRKNHPGNGLYALPGGFLENNETISAGIIRELKEETNIRVPIPVLHGFMKHIEVFDAVNRSLRGRIVTHCGLINLRNDTHLPEVRGDDDAEKAMWVPTSEILSNYRHIMFEDHFDIVTKMISLIK